MRELTYAKDIQDILRIQMKFVRVQLEAFGEQAKDLGEAYIKAASGQNEKAVAARNNKPEVLLRLLNRRE